MRLTEVPYPWPAALPIRAPRPKTWRTASRRSRGGHAFHQLRLCLSSTHPSSLRHRKRRSLLRRPHTASPSREPSMPLSAGKKSSMRWNGARAALTRQTRAKSALIRNPLGEKRVDTSTLGENCIHTNGSGEKCTHTTAAIQTRGN